MPPAAQQNMPPLLVCYVVLFFGFLMPLSLLLLTELRLLEIFCDSLKSRFMHLNPTTDSLVSGTAGMLGSISVYVSAVSALVTFCVRGCSLSSLLAEAFKFCLQRR